MRAFSAIALAALLTACQAAQGELRVAGGAAAPTTTPLENGRGLLSLCEGTDPNLEPLVQRAGCLGFITGFMGHAGTLHRLGQRFLPCNPMPGLSMGQIRLVFINWAHENPEYLDRRAADVLAASIRQTYNCE